MRRNYALEPEELAAGYVLTCQSLPVSDELTVDYDA
jgi:ring-1,2-phenylacetyl-CoA epoxidase subunit PaaE